MNDNISRKAAIDAINHELRCGAVIDQCGLETAHDLIEELPSAQPEQSLDIQDILEYLDTVLHPIISPDHWSVYSELHDMISMLPSAQPEIIHCKDCKWLTEQEDSLQGRCALLGMYRLGGWYCASGRREDGRLNQQTGGA